MLAGQRCMCGPVLQAANEAFKNTVSGDVVAAHVKEIQVLQAECALVDLSCEPNDDVCLSSEEAATCCLVVLRCSISRRLFIAHLDESTCGDGATFRGALTGMQTVCYPRSCVAARFSTPFCTRRLS